MGGLSGLTVNRFPRAPSSVTSESTTESSGSSYQKSRLADKRITKTYEGEKHL